MGLHRPALSCTRTELDSVPIQENTGQQKLAFSHNLCSDYELSQQC